MFIQGGQDMVIRKNLKITRDEIIHYLFTESTMVAGLFASTLASILTFALGFASMHFVKILVIGINEIVILSICSVLVGIGIYFIKKQEYSLYEKTNSPFFLSGVFAYPFLILLFTVLFMYFMGQKPQEDSAYNYFAAIITVLLVAAAFSYLFFGVWKLLDYLILKFFAKRDWVILAEREYFLNGLGLRFEEARRYNNSLSLVNIRIDLIPNKFKKMLMGIYKRISTSLREIDSISHFDDWNNIVVLAPITLPSAELMFKRIVQAVHDELLTKGYKDKVMVVAGISTVSSETHNEFDLLKPQGQMKEEVKVVIV